jgi:anthranilate phosphoribosyltransferase
MPTLNAEAILENCLASIARQTYPRDRYEIILADAHSKDRTREIAARYGAQVLDDNGKNMEEGKRLALRHSHGEYIVFVDADNEFSHPDYVELAVKALAERPNALGVEAYYPASPKMTSFCAYVTQSLHISDPIAWLMSTNPILAGCEGEIERWTLPENSLAYPLGANGFVFRRSDLEQTNASEHFQDTHVPLRLMRMGKREWLRLRGRGVHHYYVPTLWGFVKKRRRAVVHFMRVQEEMPVNWMKEKPPVPLWLAGVYCASIVGPAWHTARGIVRDHDWHWLWHTPACLGTLVGSAWGVWTFKRRGKEHKLIAELQVEQKVGTVEVPSAETTAASPAPAPPVRGLLLERLSKQLAASKSLSDDQVSLAVEELVDETVPVSQKADFLTALSRKGETAEEITSFVRALHARCLQPKLDGEIRSREILDVVGTGGDRMGTFNISTTVALVAAAAGVLVAKHGNRASTSSVGSADVLEALGVPFDLGPEEAARSLREHGFAFFFAPKYHPAFRHIIPARRLCGERGQVTIFNFLGPLLNPASPSAMLIGVPRPALCEPLARVLQSVGVRRAMVVCGTVPGHDGRPARYLDEISSLGPTTVAEFYPQRGLSLSTIVPETFPLQAARLEDLAGGDRESNASLIRGLLRGDEKGPRRDVVLLNAAAALFVANAAENLRAGWDLAGAVINDGRALRKLEELTRPAG